MGGVLCNDYPLLPLIVIQPCNGDTLNFISIEHGNELNPRRKGLATDVEFNYVKAVVGTTVLKFYELAKLLKKCQ